MTTSSSSSSNSNSSGQQPPLLLQQLSSSLSSPPPPTIQEITNACDNNDDINDDNNINDPTTEHDPCDFSTNVNTESHKKSTTSTSASPAYTATTVAAISSLMNDEPPPPSSSSSLPLSTISKREYTLQDRASAVISVYKDYIQEGESIHRNDDDDDNDVYNYKEGGKMGDDTTTTQLLQNIRRREIKNVTLQKFCNDVLSLSSSDDDDDEDIMIQDEFIDDTTGSNLGRGAFGGSSNTLLRQTPPLPSSAILGDGGGGGGGGVSRKRRSPPVPKPKLPPPTAASTTAAFRLRAEVALKSVSTKTSRVARRTALAVGTAVRDKITNTANIQEDGMKNDYDFQDYNDNNIVVSEGDSTSRIGGESKQIQKSSSSSSRSRGKASVPDERKDDLEHGEIITENDGENAVYGMHILDRDARSYSLSSSSLRRKMEINEGDEMFHELCDDLGVTPQTHPQIRYFYEPPSYSLRYRYPIFRSKKFKQAMLYLVALLLFLIVCVSILSAVSNGFEEVRKKNAPPLPDWKGVDDWQMTQKVEWETRKELFGKVSAAYRPVWYDRSTGWRGQTYDEAMAWCKSYLNYIPCPYEVYCPDEKTLLSGVMVKGRESWAPIINANNEWVQVGSTGKPCDLYSMLYGSHPAWGTNGARNDLTRNIMCCRAQPLLDGSSSWNDTRKSEDEYVVRPKVPPTKYEGDGGQQQQQQQPVDSVSAETSPAFDIDVLFFSVSKKYNPIWFDRSSGWKGQTYQEALDFCANFKSYIPCPYDAYCPGGQGMLLDGVREEGESWSAVIDKANDWVQVGTGGRCNLYSETEKEQPSWGLTGQNNEKITRHIMCCDEEPYVASITGSDVMSNTSPKEAATSPPYVVMPEPDNTLTDMEIDVADFYNPTWFDSSSGWMGTTYADAKVFCESMPRRDSGVGGGTLHLCPSEAVCPNGPHNIKPLYFQMDSFSDVQWTPISDSENGWIMVGTIAGDEDYTCHTYTEIFQTDPEWGMDGSSPAVVQHILCCEDNSGAGGIDNLISNTSNNMPSEVETSTESNSDGGTKSDQEASTPVEGATVSETSANTPSAIASSVISKFSPIWFTADEGGWEGGSHDDAIAFCQQFAGSHGGKMDVCPYAAYCPQGPTKPVLGGHDANFEEEGEQWAPLYGQSNHWVMIGKKGTNMSTTCLTYVQLNGEKPSWGVDSSHQEMKQHLMCCSSLQ